MTNYKGNRWYKCDFHLHTPASKCFLDKDITPEEFIAKVKKENLDCIAITDHNSAGWIEEIQNVAKLEDIIVFPGVEITCDGSKVHILVLFDVDCKKIDIEDFLRDAGINRSSFGTTTAYSSRTIMEIAKLAKDAGAIIIPAHVDDYSGLFRIDNKSMLNDFLSLETLKAVQMVNEELAVGVLNSTNEEESIKKLESKFSKEDIIATNRIKDERKGILTFSDNPDEDKPNKHGLYGIGKQYSWIKMCEKPTLESLRQALLFPEARIKNCFEKNNGMFKFPDLWINKIKISNIELLNDKPLEVEFNPQLNSIIGGRGSGKSTIIRFLTGIFFNDDVKKLNDIFKELDNFYKSKDAGYGVLKNNTEIEVELVKNDKVYRVIKKNIKKIDKADIIIEKLNSNYEFEVVKDKTINDLFKIDIYNQKQIYELAKNTNILREKIDSLIDGLDCKKKIAKSYLYEYTKQFIYIRNIENKISDKNKILAELDDVNEKIEMYNELEINAIIDEYKNYKSQFNITNKYVEYLDVKINILEEQIKNLSSKFSIQDFITKNISIDNDIYNLIEQNEIVVELEIKQLKNSILNLKKIKENYIDSIRKSEFYNNYNLIEKEYKDSLKKLEDRGVDISNVNKLIAKQEIKNNELKNINKNENLLNNEYIKLKELRESYIESRKDITRVRNEVVSNLLKGTTINLKVIPFRDAENFNDKFRKIIGKETGFSGEIDKVKKFCFKGDISKKINEFFEKVSKLKYNNEEIEGFEARFVKILKNIKDTDLAELGIFLPEDEIQIFYKPDNSNDFKPINSGSAGQKTSAILTFILSDGKNPLILDQPEDDLDNHLIYSLVVDRLQICKEYRQIIVVTHNANIPVNGDAELITAMNSNSKFIEVLQSGTMEEELLKNEICSVMEGGENAFKMRANRYGINKF